MIPLTIGDTSAMPPVAVAREALGEDGIRITIEWASRQRLHTRLVDLTTESTCSTARSRIPSRSTSNGQ